MPVIPRCRASPPPSPKAPWPFACRVPDPGHLYGDCRYRVGNLSQIVESSHILIVLSFVIGCIFCALAGFIGMRIATKANVPTTQAARTSLARALNVSFSGGLVMGLGVARLAVLGLSLLFIFFYQYFSMNGPNGQLPANDPGARSTSRILGRCGIDRAVRSALVVESIPKPLTLAQTSSAKWKRYSRRRSPQSGHDR